VICHAAWSQGVFGATVRRAGVPLVFWVHDALTGRHWTERWARRAAPALAICNSEFTARTLPSLYRDVPFRVVYAPVDAAAAGARSPTDRRAIRKQFQTPDEAVVIVQASRMEAWKGHQVVLDALARLRTSTRWVWWIAGGAQRPAERSYVASLVESARRLRLADRLRWLGDRQDVASILTAADIHCQANVRPEPFGIAYVEALAAGLPVVASASGGAVEVVDASCGLLVPPGDADSLAVALERLIDDETLRARLASHAAARARAVSDPETQIRRLAVALHGMSPVKVAV
jgi:glycosyltransferase involved in cell wall biosynthesis